MAKITLEYDTNTKEMALAIDGTPVENVSSLSIYQSYSDEDEFCLNITTVSKDEDHDLRTYTQLMASETAAAREGLQRGTACVSTDFPDFVVARSTAENRVHADIAAFFDRG